MPKYDLICTDCGAEHKIWASISEKSEGKIECPDCGSEKLESTYKTAPAQINGKACPARNSCAACPHS